MGTDNAQAKPRLILQANQRERGPERADFTKRLMERHGQDESGLYQRSVGFGNRGWAGLVGRGWSPTEITIAILEQNGGYAHVCRTPGMGTYIDWMITPDGKKIGSDGRGGLQFYVNKSLPFIVEGGKVVWLNSDNPILGENDRLEWRYDPYTQEMPDILGKKKENGGCMGGANDVDLTKLRVRSFGGYDPSAERIAMLPPALDGNSLFGADAPHRDIPFGRMGYLPGNIVPMIDLALPDAMMAKSLEQHSFGIKIRKISRLRRPEKPLPKQGKESLVGERAHQAPVHINTPAYSSETGKTNPEARAVEIPAEIAPKAIETKASVAGIQQIAAMFDGLGEKAATRDEVRAASAPAIENFWGREEPAQKTEKGASAPRWEETARIRTRQEGLREKLRAKKKESPREAKEGRQKKADGKEAPKKAPTAAKKEKEKGKRRKETAHPGIIAKREKNGLAKAAVPEKRVAKNGFRKTVPAVELKIIRLKKERKAAGEGLERKAPKEKAATENRPRKKEAGEKKKPKKDRGVEYLLMGKKSRKKRRNWLSISRR